MAECSDDLHELLHTMVEIKVFHNARTAGREETEEACASTIAYLRRQISVCVVRAAADSLFSRLLQVGQQGPGASQAAKRRAQAMAREEKGRKERAAHWLLHTKSRILQRGQFMAA